MIIFLKAKYNEGNLDGSLLTEDAELVLVGIRVFPETN